MHFADSAAAEKKSFSTEENKFLVETFEFGSIGKLAHMEREELSRKSLPTITLVSSDDFLSLCFFFSGHEVER